eukprot:GHVL01020724.1.p1 GENE.GHVL01020724.1~~GHVL01020724.1.p1  ORF type:complete len:333 (+),score=117.23 GHVL01020724.1:511-1509(+)
MEKKREIKELSEDLAKIFNEKDEENNDIYKKNKKKYKKSYNIKNGGEILNNYMLDKKKTNDMKCDSWMRLKMKKHFFEFFGKISEKEKEALVLGMKRLRFNPIFDDFNKKRKISNIPNIFIKINKKLFSSKSAINHFNINNHFLSYLKYNNIYLTKLSIIQIDNISDIYIHFSRNDPLLERCNDPPQGQGGNDAPQKGCNESFPLICKEMETELKCVTDDNGYNIYMSFPGGHDKTEESLSLCGLVDEWSRCFELSQNTTLTSSEIEFLGFYAELLGKPTRGGGGKCRGGGTFFGKDNLLISTEAELTANIVMGPFTSIPVWTIYAIHTGTK